jgi:hypothetical protein
MATAPAGPETCNADIAHLWRICNRIIFEAQHSQSAGVTYTIDADLKRTSKNLDDLKVRLENVRERGIPDNPETQPLTMALTNDPPDIDFENDDLKSVVADVYILRDELVGSQSSRLGGGLIAPDLERVLAMHSRLMLTFAKFIPATDPKDNPESTPSVAMVAAGRTGINP